MPTVNLDTSARLDIICRRGDTFDLTVDFNASLSSYAATAWKLQVRDSDTNNSADAADILIEVPGVQSSDSSTTGFSVSSTALTIRIKSSDMDVDSGLYVYDLQTNVSGVKTWLHGEFKIVEDITI